MVCESIPILALPSIGERMLNSLVLECLRDHRTRLLSTIADRQSAAAHHAAQMEKNQSNLIKDHAKLYAIDALLAQEGTVAAPSLAAEPEDAPTAYENIR
jgi:hypothetical protein